MDYQVKVGEQVSIPLTVQLSGTFEFLSLFAGFDPSLLRVDSFQLDTILPNNIMARANNDKGFIDFAGIDLQGTLSPDQPYTPVTITVTGLAASIGTPISLAYTAPRASQGAYQGSVLEVGQFQINVVVAEVVPHPVPDISGVGATKFKATFGKSVGQDGFDPTYDFNDDGTVDIVDWQIFCQHYVSAVDAAEA